MNIAQNKLHFINKCCNHVKYSVNNYYIYYKTLILIYILIYIYLIYIYIHPEINIQSRRGNIKHNSGADSQVGRLMADTEVIQKSLSFLKRMWSAVRLLQGGQQSQLD